MKRTKCICIRCIRMRIHIRQDEGTNWWYLKLAPAIKMNAIHYICKSSIGIIAPYSYSSKMIDQCDQPIHPIYHPETPISTRDEKRRRLSQEYGSVRRNGGEREGYIFPSLRCCLSRRLFLETCLGLQFSSVLIRNPWRIRRRRHRPPSRCRHRHRSTARRRSRRHPRRPRSRHPPGTAPAPRRRG